jgi:hypothetical protein
MALFVSFSVGHEILSAWWLSSTSSDDWYVATLWPVLVCDEMWGISSAEPGKHTYYPCILLLERMFAFTLWTNSISWESCQVAIHNWNSQWSQVSTLYQNIEALYICPHILVLFSCGTKSHIVSFWLTRKTASISLCNVPGSCVLSDGTYRYWTGKCYLSSRFHLKLISGI